MSLGAATWTALHPPSHHQALGPLARPPSPLLPLRLSLPVPTASSPACKAAYLVEVESRESQEEVRSASDFSYFGREPAELHVCKRSVGQEGVGASLWGLPREGARSGVWG